MLPNYSSPNAIALKEGATTLTYSELQLAVNGVASWLIEEKVHRVAIAFDNQIAWVICDLACQHANVCCVPLPLFFSASQKAHVLRASQCECLLTSKNVTNITPVYRTINSVLGIVAHKLDGSGKVHMPQGTNKITFTSGSTGSPKGVCLSTESQWKVARSIHAVFGNTPVHHLCMLPLSTLLENIAGVYAPLIHGGTVELVSAKARGFEGSKLVNPQALLCSIDNAQPTSVILVPDLLIALLMACQRGWRPPTSLQFIAVGGAHVAPDLLKQAHRYGLPVYEGYGLSEAVSVSTLNRPAEHHFPGTAGPALGHNQLHIENGEVVVTGNHFLGYLNQPDSFYPNKVYTGDLGHIKNGVLTLNGRKKNVMVNSFGRNVSPEWIESLLLATGLFRHAVVYCEAKPYCIALICPLSADMTSEQIMRIIQQVNQTLPDYAQVLQATIIDPCTTNNGLLTETGKLKRAAVLSRYQNQISTLYPSQHIVNGD